MAELTLKQTIDIAKRDPEFANKLAEDMATGIFDDIALNEGVDISAFSPTYAQKRGNVGTGFEPTFEYTGEESIPGAVVKAAGNVPKSGFELGKNIVKAVSKPKQTIKAVGSLVKGGGAALAEAGLEKTGIGQQIMQKIDEARQTQGLEPLQRDAEGRLQVVETPDLQVAKQVGDFFEERYGGLDNIKETVIEDPVGFLADLSVVLSGAGTLTAKAGQASKVAEVSKVGQAISKAGQVIEPTTVAGKATETLGKFKKAAGSKLGETLPAIASDVAPFSREAITRGGVIKALDLTPSDVTKFEKITGNKLDDFVLNRTNSNTVSGIADELPVIRKGAYDETRNLISQVKKTYSGNEAVRMKQVLGTLEDVYKNTIGNEDILLEIQKLKGNKTYKLDDFQRVKELIDEADLIYTKSGKDLKSGATAKGLGNTRSDIKSFIENEVKNNLDLDENVIEKLNNDVQTTKELEQMILQRATRDLSRQGITIFELLLGVGGFSQFGLGGATAILATKRLVESPAFRLALARGVNSLNKKALSNISKEIKAGKLTDETVEVLNALKDEAAQNMQFIETGANVLDEASLSPK